MLAVSVKTLGMLYSSSIFKLLVMQFAVQLKEVGFGGLGEPGSVVVLALFLGDSLVMMLLILMWCPLCGIKFRNSSKSVIRNSKVLPSISFLI